MERTFEFEVNRRSSAAPATLFALETDAHAWSRWARPLVLTSRWHTEPDPAGAGGVRRVGAGPVAVFEQTDAYEKDRRHAYSLVDGKPLRGYRAEVVFTERADGGTDIHWQGSFVEPLPGSGPALRLALRSVVAFLAARLAAAAERG